MCLPLHDLPCVDESPEFERAEAEKSLSLEESETHITLHGLETLIIQNGWRNLFKTFSLFVIDETFYAVVKTHKHRSNKIYNSELTMKNI